MKLTTKMLLKLNPSYLNNINENELNDEIILYALENGFDFNNDKFDRYSKYDIYVKYNIEKIKEYIPYYINSPYLKYNEDINNVIIDYIKREKQSLIIRCIQKDLKFLSFLDSEFKFNNDELDELFNILKYNNINYSELNNGFITNNYYIGLKYLEKDFSNIVNFKKYNENFKNYESEILNIFSANIKESVKFLNEINEFEFNDIFKEKIINTLKEVPILINENTPKFILDNVNVVYNLLINDLSNAKYIENEINFNGEQIVKLSDKIIKEKYIFEEIPICFKNNSVIVSQIIVNNPNVVDNKDTSYFTGIYGIILELIKLDKYKITDNTRKDLLEILCLEYLDEILSKDFEYLKYFSNLNVRFSRDQEKLYDVLKNNNYIIKDNIPECFKNNPYLIKEGIEKGLVDFKDIDLNIFNNKDDLKLYFINYSIDNNIENEIINKWKKEFINRNKIDKSDKLYIKNTYVFDYNLDFPKDVKEIFIEDNDINYINWLVDKVKGSNNNIEKIVVDLKRTNYTLDELNSIKDKNMVIFGSKGDITRLTVDKLIEIEHVLDLMVKDINESNLSPYEKYIAVYNIVKSFKQYKFYKEDKEIDHEFSDQSRGIYLIMDNDYIVCVGFAHLLTTLLKRVGIDSLEWGVMAVNEGHERNYVNLVDPKYNIDGYYMSDTTWDNVQNGIMEIGYDHMHLTIDEARNESRIKKDANGKAMLGDELFNDYTDEEMLEYIKKTPGFKSTIEALDPGFYEIIKDKNINIELANIINTHFKNKINKPISIETDAKAIFELNEYIYGKSNSLEERNKKWNDFIIYNHYSKELLNDDYNERINVLTNNLKNMKIVDYYNIINKLKPYDKYCYISANSKLLEELLPHYDKTCFVLNYSNNKLTFDISISSDLFRVNKIDDIYYILIDKGYNVEKFWNEFYKINLDDNDMNKTFLELYNELHIIREDYIDILNNELKNNLSV